MTDRVYHICPACGSDKCSIRVSASPINDRIGITLDAYCISCNFSKTSLCDLRTLHFVLRVSSKDFILAFDRYKPWTWKPWHSQFLSLFRREALSCQIFESLVQLTNYSEAVPLEACNLAEHRCIRPLIRAILCSSGDYVDSMRYVSFSNGSVGYPLAR